VGSLGREVERLRQIMEDFLRYAGEFRLDPRRVDLAEVAREFADFFEPQADQHGVRLEVRADAPAPVLADPDAVKQALLNLALNAVQAMADDREAAEGVRRLEIGARAGEDEVVGPAALLWVADEGPGVPEAKREEIFRPYITSRRSGAGLGLAITRRIVSEHGGRLWVEDNEPRGARFVMALPVQEGSASDAG
jgi:signal transduction histidine kinase